MALETEPQARGFGQKIQKKRELKRVRTSLAVILALLYLQFELGMETNLANPPILAPFQFTPSHFIQNLLAVGGEALLHASNGILIFATSLMVLYFSWRSGIRSLRVFGSAAPAAIIFAMMNGVLFVLSGYQNDGPSFGMAHAFIAAFTIYTVELYFVAKWLYKT